MVIVTNCIYYYELYHCMKRLTNLIGDNYNDNQINKLKPLIKIINEYDEQWMSLTDADIKAKT